MQWMSLNLLYLLGAVQSLIAGFGPFASDLLAFMVSSSANTDDVKKIEQLEKETEDLKAQVAKQDSDLSSLVTRVKHLALKLTELKDLFRRRGVVLNRQLRNIQIRVDKMKEELNEMKKAKNSIEDEGSMDMEWLEGSEDPSDD